MWNISINVIPVITVPPGTVSESFIKYLGSITGKHKMKELHKIAIFFTAHILRKLLM